MDPLVGLRPPIADDDLLCPEEAPHDVLEIAPAESVTPEQCHLEMREKGIQILLSQDSVVVAHYARQIRNVVLAAVCVIMPGAWRDDGGVGGQTTQRKAEIKSLPTNLH